MKTGNASRRIISLSDEIKALKLRTIQDQRQHVILREENRRLGAVITSNEAVLTAADCARIEAETRLLVANSDRDLAVNQKSSDTPRDGTLPTNAILKAVDMRDAPCHFSSLS
jgi:hypothetical protein